MKTYRTPVIVLRLIAGGLVLSSSGAGAAPGARGPDLASYRERVDRAPISEEPDPIGGFVPRPGRTVATSAPSDILSGA